MFKFLHQAGWIPSFCGVVGCAVMISMAPAGAQERLPGARAPGSNPAVATDGATLIHGNYCGAGNLPGKPPIDALDLACMNHDACTPPSGIPDCDCNVRLRDEAAAVAQDARQASELRSLASLTATAAAVMICKPTIEAAVPPAPAPAVAAPAAAAPPLVSPESAVPAVVGAPVPIVPDAVEAPAGSVSVVVVPEARVRVAPVTDAPALAPRSPSLP